MTLSRASLLITAALLCLPLSARAATWYVTQAGTGDATTIQAGIDLASTGDTVLVAPGIYTDTLHVTIQGVEKVANVHLTKEIALIAEGDTTDTIIDGPDSDVALFIEGVGSSGLIEGFRIQTTFRAFACVSAAGSPDPPPEYAPPSGYRAGIWCEDASLTLRACAIEGHGVCAELYRSPMTMTDCLIGWSFWGVRLFEDSDATIEHSRAQWLAEAFECTASAPVIVDNEIGGFGGQMCTGVDCNQDGDAYIARNTFRDVQYQTIIVGPAAPIIEDNLFINGSTAIFVAAGVHVPVVRNNIFYDHGGWIIEVWTSAPVIESNTIDYAPGSNTRAIELQGASPLIRNNIISRVSAGVSCILGASPTIECNDIFDTDYPYHNECTDQTGINGNISVDPEFCGAWDTIDYRLQSDSPCAPGNHPDGYDCGQIGAKGVGCSTTPTKKSSWGAVKALYRKGDGK
jgi:hypothetical protein